jgi:hypothetical protein
VIPTLQPGQISEPIRSPLGVHLIQLLERRQGDITEAQAKHDIARELYEAARGAELANEAATHAQQLISQPGASLDAVAAQIHTDALTNFYHGVPNPPPEHMANGETLEPVSRTDIGAPELRETQPFNTRGHFPGVQNGDPLVTAAFQLTEQNPSPSAPVAVGDDRFIIRLKDNGRQVASREEFNRDKAHLMESYALAKRREALQQYITRLRAQAERNNDLRVGNSPLIQAHPTNRHREDEEGSG